MNNLKKLSLTTIVTSFLFLGVITLQSAEFVFQYQFAKHALFVEKEQFIKGVAGNLQTSLSNSLMRLEKAQAQNIVSEAELDHNLQRIAVVDHLHQIVLSNNLRDKYLFAQLQLEHYDSELLEQVIEKSKFIFQYNEKTQDLIVYAPIQMLAKDNSLNRKYNGLIYIRHSLSSAVTELRYSHLFRLIKKLAILLISLSLVVFIINRLIKKPLNNIVRSMSLMAFTHEKEIGQTGYGEVRELQRAFGVLSKQNKLRFKALSTREQRLSYALSGSQDGLWDWNIELDSVYFSERWKSMLGFKIDQVIDSVEKWESLIHKDDLISVVKALKLHFSGKQSYFESTYRLRCHNGSYCWVLSRGQTVSWDANGSPLRIIGTNTEMDHFKPSQHNLGYHAQFDNITQLPNRQQLLINIEKECVRSKHNNLYGAIVFIDCNQDKDIGSLQGQLNEQRLLFAIARRIEETKSGSDFVAHLSGCEFGIVLPDLHENREDAAELALLFTNKLEQKLTTPFKIEGQDISLNSAFGVEMFPLVGCGANNLLRQASMALKYSEQNHFSNTFFFSKEIEENIQTRQALQKQMSLGLKNDEFSLYFQPRVDGQGELIGAEALSRWLHSSKGWVNPEEFISVAEDSGLILPLGDWVIKSAFEQFAKWQAMGLPDTFKTLSINVSPKQLLQVGFTASIEHYLKETQIDPKFIEIEITESALLIDKQRIIKKLNKLCDLGFCFAIDDFGTGYSSFSYLSILPVSTLKIDQSFIFNLMHDETQQVIVTTIINMAKSLKLEVVAEGVESQSQLQFLIDQGCTQFQGYLVGKPMPKDQFQTLLFE